ncbi:UDP-N-acetylmuramate:L-alanyl-gamma-D-glutamyl-meso-diaminopimelate ligase [Amphibiibacter pelophylacis]|uniref:UDP-N-acetylmuramate:L-alanyl-gamma-D-glutamyl-meso-diaminopimelate ligase n=1 Tax=Amphibiibacter pelophylacis TaxID=1799477 RepID=A0ACC6P259_9BURK
MHIHILGICGTFMGGVAALAREAGHRVTGCDAQVYPPMSDQLRALGIDLIEGYDSAQLEQLGGTPDVFVIGNVVSRAKTGAYPLMETILDKGLPYTSGPQWLAENVLQGRHVLAVAGTHGKTTTTSMLAWILQDAGLEPGFLVGGVPQNFGVSARLGAGKHFVIEADEYDTAFFDKRSKFVHYRPRTVVLNNLEFDHADIFADLAAIETQFHHLIRTVPSTGRIVSNFDAPALDRVLTRGCYTPVQPFGLETSATGTLTASGEPHDFAVMRDGRKLAQLTWALQGRHNQMNALAALAAAEHVGIDLARGTQALGRFENVKRRMELRGTVHGVSVYDDFAHHPTAIALTLDGARRQLPARGRLLAVFEARSNTMKLGTMAAQLPGALADADAVWALQPQGWSLSDALAPLGERARVLDSVDALVADVAAACRPGDVVVGMSNGSFGGLHGKLLDALAARAAQGA